MISFRVSEREFEMLKTQAESEGARNVSEFARIALCNRRTPASGDGIDQLRRDLEELKSYVRRVAEVLEQDAPAQRAESTTKTQPEPVE
jgi:hypothetical protein